MSQFFSSFGAVPVQRLRQQLADHPELWGQQRARLVPGSPHEGTVDIWARFRDLDAYQAEYGSDMSHFVDEHESVWLPPSDDLPAIKGIATEIADGRRLGGVLITKTPPGGRIKPHTDSGWHAEAHEKYYVAIQVAPGMVFGFPDGGIEAKNGEVYKFRNDVEHWVINGSSIDRIGAIVCVRRDGT